MTGARRGYAVDQRLRLIDWLLLFYGTVRREALMDYFGISITQASHDFTAYKALAPDNMIYDPTVKAYTKTAKFVRVY